MDAKRIGYWLTTGLIALAMAGSAAGYLAGAMDADMASLGFDRTFVVTLGVWKALGAVALVVPIWPRVKEWAYAGFFFTFTGAAISHLAVADGKFAPPLVMLAILTASYFLRPAHLVVGPAPAPEPKLGAQQLA